MAHLLADLDTARVAPMLVLLRVKWDFNAADQSELTCHKGEGLQGLAELGEWWLARRGPPDEKAKIGLVPQSYVSMQGRKLIREVSKADILREEHARKGHLVHVFTAKPGHEGSVMGLEVEDVRTAFRDRPIPDGMPETVVRETDGALRPLVALEKEQRERRQRHARLVVGFGAVCAVLALVTCVVGGILVQEKKTESEGVVVFVIGAVATVAMAVYTGRFYLHEDDHFAERIGTTMNLLQTTIDQQNAEWRRRGESRGWSVEISGLRFGHSRVYTGELCVAVSILQSVAAKDSALPFSIQNPLKP